MLERWKRKRFKKKVEAAVAKLDRERRVAIYGLPVDLLADGLETGYQRSENKIKHTVDLLSTSALLHTCLHTD